MAAKNKFDELEPHDVDYGSAYVRPANLDPKVNGPFLDDIRREQENAQREARSLRFEANEAKVAALQQNFLDPSHRTEKSDSTKNAAKRIARDSTKSRGKKDAAGARKTAAKKTTVKKSTAQTKRKSAPSATDSASTPVRKDEKQVVNASGRQVRGKK